MKKVLFLMILTTVALFSCKNEKVQLVSNFEQQLSENVKIDLKFKCKSFEKINNVYSTDSSNHYQKFLAKETGWSADSVLYKSVEIENAFSKFNLNIKEFDDLQNKIEYYKTNNINKALEFVKIREKKFNENEKLFNKLYKLDNANKQMTEYTNEGYTEYILKILYKYRHYKDMPNKLLCTKYKCVYTIFNPMVNAKQEITKTYYISPKNEIIKTEV